MNVNQTRVLARTPPELGEADAGEPQSKTATYVYDGDRIAMELREAGHVTVFHYDDIGERVGLSDEGE